MTDPLGLIGNIGNAERLGRGISRFAPADRNEIGPDFKQVLQSQIDQVNQLQNDANLAIEDLATGQRDDVESVIIATQKADIAFKMLLAVRNKVMDAYEEVKQLRI